eukprot:TRINITY_DN30476_c0_g1_i1.p2 TRINITY_DN30476_c0_g1~~TRINITY_DN30476_c0_g1_i1.p2  ORF type:complete len:351 (+),score=94.95 TRINITY_DN30476_c0_g1_i1:85-1137(+)
MSGWPGWHAHSDEVTGRPYWVHHETGACEWGATPEEQPRPAGADSALKKAEAVFAHYDVDGDGVWCEAEVRGPAGVMPGMSAAEWAARCEMMLVDPAKGWVCADVVQMYLSQPSLDALERDLAGIAAGGRPSATPVLPAADLLSAATRVNLPPPPPPVEAPGAAVISAKVQKQKQRRGRRVEKPDRGAVVDHAPDAPATAQPAAGAEGAGVFTSTEQALIDYYDGLLFKSYLQQEQLQHVAVQALRHSRSVCEAMCVDEGSHGYSPSPGGAHAARPPPLRPGAYGAPLHSSLKKTFPPAMSPGAALPPPRPFSQSQSHSYSHSYSPPPSQSTRASTSTSSTPPRRRPSPS